MCSPGTRSATALLAGHCDAPTADRQPHPSAVPRCRTRASSTATGTIEAARAVASLRLVAGRFPDDRGLAELVGELAVKSPEFAALWARHPVASCVSGTRRLRHPELGELEVEFQALDLPDGSGQRILTYTGGSELLRAPS